MSGATSGCTISQAGIACHAVCRCLTTFLSPERAAPQHVLFSARCHSNLRNCITNLASHLLHDQVAKPKAKADKADKGKEAPKEAEKPADSASEEDDADDAEPEDEEPEDLKVCPCANILSASQNIAVGPWHAPLSNT